MHVDEFLSPSDVSIDFRAVHKQALLQSLAQVMAKSSPLPADAIARSLTERERLGATGTGHGIAIPHARMPHLLKPATHFARLDQPIDYGALDDQPVDLVFVILLPDRAGSTPLNILACAARKLRDEGTQRRLRQARDASSLYSALIA